MGNCQQQGAQSKIFDEKNTVESYEAGSNYNQNRPVKGEAGRSAASSSATTNANSHAKSQGNSASNSKGNSYPGGNGNGMGECPYTFIRRPAPTFQGVSYHNEFKNISLRDFKGQYVVLFFFPLDFSETCRQEILAFSDLNEKFAKASCQVIGCSQDSQFAHMNYCKKSRNEGGLGALEFPLLADVDKQISTSYGVGIDESENSDKGATFRSTFIIDTNQILRHMSINDIAISVNPDEVLRLVYTFQQFDRENPSKGAASGCPFAAHSREMAKDNNQDIDTFSRYQRKKSEKAKDPQEKESNEGNHAKSGQGTASTSAGSSLKDEKVSLFTRLGGSEEIKGITDKFVTYIFSDPLLKPYFMNKTGQSKHKKVVGCFFQAYLGGPEPYNGRNMREAHKDLKLTDEHFDKAIDYLRTILIDSKVEPPLIQEFIMQIEPLRSQITQKPTMSLFDRVNGRPGIKKAIGIYFTTIMKYSEVKQMFAKSDMEKVQESYVEYLSLVFGGASKYKGKQMKDAHSNLHIKENLFSVSVAQIQSAFGETGVDKNSINEIGRLLDCLRSEIPRRKDTLVQRMGGVPVIEMACKKLYEDKILSQEKIKDFFKGCDMKALGAKMADFYLMIAGGPQRYQGKSAKDAHKSFNIMSHQFNVYKKLLQETFLECGAEKESVAEFMNLIDTIKIDVIGGKPPSLFEKIGGEETINYFSEKLFLNIMEEVKIRHYFINVDLNSVKKHFKEFLIMATGGPSKYQGENVRDHHEQMDISTKDYNVFMQVVKKTVAVTNGENKLKTEFAQEVITFFESMRQMIVSVED